MMPEEEANIFGQRARQYIADRLEHVRREARNSALEEAAKIAEAMTNGGASEGDAGWDSALESAAAAIRGMIK